MGGGFVASLARPGGNATGFTTSEFSMFGKRLELLKEIAPGVTARSRHPGPLGALPGSVGLPLSKPWRRRFAWS